MKRVKADGVYYYNTKGGLTQETFSETLAHERIDNLFERIGELEHGFETLPYEYPTYEK